MIKVAILSFSDGRERVHETLREYIKSCENAVADALRATGEVEIISCGDIIHSNHMAAENAKKALDAHADACIFNVCVFSFPNYSAIAGSLQQTPILAIAPNNGAYPGLGGLQAAVNFIRQTGGVCEKIWGNISDDKILSRAMVFLRAAKAASSLRGQVLGLFGGRSIGMGSGAVNPDLWMQKFGVDVDHIDQLEIIRRAELMEDTAADKAISWLEKNMRFVCYDENKLTEQALRMQVKCYLALKELIRERGLDFVAVKCHYELSEYYVAQCLAAAFANDPYDWDGPKETVAYACEADADAALTMQILKLITGKPVLFMDFRHYLEEEGVFAFCNCGACATWYANRSCDPSENLRDVTLHPLIPKYAGKGCHVQFIAAAGGMTFARLTRQMDKYKMQVFSGRAEKLPAEKLELTCPVWPHAYAKVDSDPYELVQQYECNHIHAVEGNCVEELKKFCELKDIIFEEL